MNYDIVKESPEACAVAFITFMTTGSFTATSRPQTCSSATEYAHVHVCVCVCVCVCV